MMPLQARLLLLVFILLGPGAFCQVQTSKWPVYKNTALHYNIHFPTGWDTVSLSSRSAFFKPKTQDTATGYEQNVNITVQDLSSHPMSLKEYTEMSAKQFAVTGNARILYQKSRKLAHVKAYETVYNMPIMGRELKFKAVWFIKDNNAYVITFSAEPQTFDAYVAVADGMINSFTFVK